MSSKLKSAARFTAANAAREAASSVQNISGSNAGSDEGMSQGTSALGAGMSAFVTAAEENSRRKDQFNDKIAQEAEKSGGYSGASERTETGGLASKEVGSQFSTETKNSRAAKAFSTRRQGVKEKSSAFKAARRVLEDGGVSSAERGGDFDIAGEGDAHIRASRRADKGQFHGKNDPLKGKSLKKKRNQQSPKKKKLPAAAARGAAAQSLEDVGGEFGETVGSVRSTYRNTRRTARGIKSAYRGTKDAVNYSRVAAKRMSMAMARALEAGRAMKGMSASQKMQAISKAAARAVAAATRATLHTLGAILAPLLLPILILMLIITLLTAVFAADEEQHAAAIGSGAPVDKILYIAAFFRDNGLDDLHAAAIIGNMMCEGGSELPTDSIESGAGPYSDAEILALPDGQAQPGIGLCQWSGPRRRNLVNYSRQRATTEGKDPEGSWKNIDYQLEFFMHHDEWHMEWSDGRGGNTKREFLETDDLATATKIFCKGWERPGHENLENRVKCAEQAMAVIQGGGDVEAVIDFALQQVGDAYDIGHTGPDIWDCSGLTMVAYAQIGVNLPHSAALQFNLVNSLGNNKTDVKDYQPGDLVFYHYRASDYGHVALYIGNNQVVHANGKGNGVHVTDVFFDGTPTGAGRPY